MKVILTKEVLGLGDPGQVVAVKRGYGRNYLIPQGIAIEATRKNLAVVQAQTASIAAAQAREAERVRSEAGNLSAVVLSLKVKAGEGGRLYGSVTNIDLAAALAQQGFTIDRRRIILEAPIKRVGEHTFKVRLHPQVVVDLKVTVEADAASAEPAEAEAAPTAEAPAAEPAEGEEQAEAAAAKPKTKGKGKKAAKKDAEAKPASEAASETSSEE